MNKKQKKNLYRIIAALVLVLILKLLPQFPTPVELLLYCIPYLVVGWDVLRKALLGIRNRQPFDECFLMAVATVGAFALGDYVEGCAVIIFYQIGELFQSVAVGKSRQSISSLMDIRPDYANVEDEDGKLEQVDPDDVEVGTVIVVQPGERVPIDGIIVEGTSALNTAALTGESLPRDVRSGDEVISGCVNMTGLLKVRTTKEFGESTVSKILDLVENSSMKKARTENFITRFARVYTPAVCYGALALAFVPPIVLLLMGQPVAGIARALDRRGDHQPPAEQRIGQFEVEFVRSQVQGQPASADSLHPLVLEQFLVGSRLGGGIGLLLLFLVALLVPGPGFHGGRTGRPGGDSTPFQACR